MADFYNTIRIPILKFMWCKIWVKALKLIKKYIILKKFRKKLIKKY